MHFKGGFAMKKLVLALVLSLGCSHTEGAQAGGGKTLYERLGGKDAISSVVDDFVSNVAGDSRINQQFANADIPHLKQMLVEQICQASGGPCTYSGKDMKTAHKGRNISDGDFGALVEDLKKSLDKFKV